MRNRKRIAQRGLDAASLDFEMQFAKNSNRTELNLRAMLARLLRQIRESVGFC
ncbi:MAG: hypothetical protein K8U57_10020 [Planctomycetes bacterium]|nr:hypothetical protein [Planctomycetota bacterium]